MKRTLNQEFPNHVLFKNEKLLFKKSKDQCLIVQCHLYVCVTGKLHELTIVKMVIKLHLKMCLQQVSIGSLVITVNYAEILCLCYQNTLTKCPKNRQLYTNTSKRKSTGAQISLKENHTSSNTFPPQILLQLNLFIEFKT